MDDRVCNKCGKRLKVEKGIPKEDFVQVQKTWGYFSKKDGTIQRFIICEDCLEQLEKEFVIPSGLEDVTEWM
ncbi:MAG: hypothetical protein IJ801_03970 [Lachnospiraceae bacterium]|nr:hypothetical protein [Lachnospiraceae bacterium]